MNAAYVIVAAVAQASTQLATVAAWSAAASRVSTHVPAATMVAAWIRADAGVGPSMASMSQSWKGICADFPSTPMTRAVMATSVARLPSACWTTAP